MAINAKLQFFSCYMFPIPWWAGFWLPIVQASHPAPSPHKWWESLEHLTCLPHDILRMCDFMIIAHACSQWSITQHRHCWSCGCCWEDRSALEGLSIHHIFLKWPWRLSLYQHSTAHYMSLWHQGEHRTQLFTEAFQRLLDAIVSERQHCELWQGDCLLSHSNEMTLWQCRTWRFSRSFLNIIPVA